MKKMGNGKQGKVGSKEGLVKLVDAMRDVPAMDLDVEKWTVTDYDTVVGTEELEARARKKKRKLDSGAAEFFQVVKKGGNS